MVDQQDLNMANLLAAQITQITQAIDILENQNGRITQMMIATGTDVTPGAEVWQDTSYMTYPPEMINAIVAQMQAQLDKLNSEIAALGVSGVARSPRTASRKR